MVEKTYLSASSVEIFCHACRNTTVIQGYTSTSVPKGAALTRERFYCPHCHAQMDIKVMSSFTPTISFGDMQTLSNWANSKQSTDTSTDTGSWFAAFSMRRRVINGEVFIERSPTVLNMVGYLFLGLAFISILFTSSELVFSVLIGGDITTKPYAINSFLMALLSVYGMHVSNKSYRDTGIQPEYSDVVIIGAAQVSSTIVTSLVYHAWSALIYYIATGSVMGYFQYFNNM